MEERISIHEILVWGKGYLREKDIESYSIDAEILLAHVTGLDRQDLIRDKYAMLSSNIHGQYASLLKKRRKHMPVAYIMKKCEFYSLLFYVDERVLIPRPETEILVESVLRAIKSYSYHSILEIGTGSGCISVALAKSNKSIKITATDIDENALDVAKQNAQMNGVLDRIKFIKSDLFKNIQEKNFDCVVSNPPYISTDEILTLGNNVKDYEPIIALDGGEDGLSFYRQIIESAGNYFSNKINGMLFFEIGYSQAEDVKKILIKNKYDERRINVIKDYSKHDRVISSHKPKVH